MSELTLNVETRKASGTQAVKKLRREEKIPGVFYFHGQENIQVAVDRKDLHSIWGHQAGLMKLIIDGKTDKMAIIRDIQFDPIKGKPIHIDFLGIKMDEKVKVSVALHLVGTPDGVKNQGGVLQQLFREIEIECLPGDIPEFIELDVTALNIHDSLHIKDLDVPNAEILHDEDTNIATVTPPRVTIEEEEAAAAEAEGEIEEDDESAEPEVLSQKSEEEE